MSVLFSYNILIYISHNHKFLQVLSCHLRIERTIKMKQQVLLFKSFQQKASENTLTLRMQCMSVAQWLRSLQSCCKRCVCCDFNMPKITVKIERKKNLHWRYARQAIFHCFYKREKIYDTNLLTPSNTAIQMSESVDSICRDGASAQYMHYLSKSCITSPQIC